MDGLLFSQEDADLRAMRWSSDRDGYAKRAFYSNGRQSMRVAHRIVLERVLGRPLVPGEICDHINRVRLDCRRENLRVTDVAGNAANRSGRIYLLGLPDGMARGVTFHKKAGKWQALVAGRYLGLFADLDDALRAARLERDRIDESKETA
jgi:hypothetical protein